MIISETVADYHNKDMYKRTLDLNNLLKNRSYFLFGPRATGKSSLIQSDLANGTIILDLLDSELFLRLKANPSELETIVLAQDKHDLVVIDEVQRIPEILNEVHRLIERLKIKFLLTGSSARKLKRNQANLLAGRARTAELFPLTYKEINNFDLNRYLHFGGLPIVYLSEDPFDDLQAYVKTYLHEEIQAEALVRSLPAFTRFLSFSALTCGELINFSNIASDAAIPASSVREYYHILEDTFIGFLLPAYTKTVKRKAISTAKFYYFDIGVKNAIARIRHIDRNSDLYGKVFEHFIVLELRAYISYSRKHLEMSYWQSKSGFEVDIVVEDNVAIEIKSTKKVHDKHLKGLKALAEENIISNYYLISQDKLKRKVDNIIIIYWQDFLNLLWKGEIF